jgi:hypothetical protein
LPTNAPEGEGLRRFSVEGQHFCSEDCRRRNAKYDTWSRSAMTISQNLVMLKTTMNLSDG